MNLIDTIFKLVLIMTSKELAISISIIFSLMIKHATNYSSRPVFHSKLKDEISLLALLSPLSSLSQLFKLSQLSTLFTTPETLFLSSLFSEIWDSWKCWSSFSLFLSNFWHFFSITAFSSFLPCLYNFLIYSFSYVY